MVTRRVGRLAATSAAASVLALAVTGSAAAPAAAAPPGPSSELVCPSQTYTIVGWHRGNTFHVVGTTNRFVVTRAVRNGVVVVDSPAQADRPLVTCTSVSPIPTGPNGEFATFVFTGFFTPAS